MKRYLLLFIYLFGGLALAADLKLSDGRTFTDFQIVSQTPMTVMVRHAKGAAKVQKNLLPPDVLAKYPIDEKGAIAEAEDNAKGKAIYQAKVDATHAADKKLSDEQMVQRKKERELEMMNAINREEENKRFIAQMAAQEAQKKKIASSPDSIADAVKRAVQRRATEYYQSEYTATLGHAPTSDIRTELNEPRAVPGWGGRFEVTGSAWFEYSDGLRYGTFKSMHQYFIAIIEQPPGSKG